MIGCLVVEKKIYFCKDESELIRWGRKWEWERERMY